MRSDSIHDHNYDYEMVFLSDNTSTSDTITGVDILLYIQSHQKIISF